MFKKLYNLEWILLKQENVGLLPAEMHQRKMLLSQNLRIWILSKQKSHDPIYNNINWKEIKEKCMISI